MNQSKAIRTTLENEGISVSSVRKNTRMVGGKRYNFHGGIRQGNTPGKPYHFFLVELLSSSEDELDLAVLFLNDAGYKAKVTYRGLEVRVPDVWA